MAAATSTESGASEAAWPSPPVYSFVTAPRPSASVDIKDAKSGTRDNFFRSARWTGDASSVLTTSEDRALRLYDTQFTDDQPSLSSARVFVQPDAINVATWYPLASRQDPASFCLVAGVRDTPVRLLDAADGRLRASYPIVDHRERFIAPHSIAFNTTADRMYCGFENAIEVFDVATPGYGTATRIKTTFTRREKGGQKGLISALAFSTHRVGSFAAGSFSGSVALYDEDTGQATGHVEGVEGSGVTQVEYHPLDENVLFVASRRSEAIQVYDLRDASASVGQLKRPGSTNQRIRFDADPWGRWLASGDEHGVVRIWDISSTEFEVLFEQKLHEDAVNSVQFHPLKPLLLTSSGSRAHLQDEDLQFSSDESDATSSSSDEDEPALVHPKAGATDSRLVVWNMSGSA